MVRRISKVLLVMFLIVNLISCGSKKIENANTNDSMEQAQLVDKLLNSSNNEAKSIPTQSDEEYSFNVNGSFDVNGVIKIQLIGVGNEKEEPFMVKKIEGNSSHMTVFTLEDGSTRVVNCEYKEVK